MTYATVQNVADELGRPTIASVTEATQITTWLTRTEATIKVRIGDLDARVSAGTLDAELVASIEAAVVSRKVLNPGGKQNERVDDYSYGLVADAATVDLALTDHEWGLLMPVQTGQQAFSTRPSFTPDAASVETLGWP